MTGHGFAPQTGFVIQGEGGAAQPAVPYGSIDGSTFINIRFLRIRLYDRFDQL